jgi:hypothetical protein
MSPFVLTLTMTWCLLSPRPAMPASGAQPARAERTHVPGSGLTAAQQARPLQAQAPFVITRETEVRLDGRRCEYEEVPEDAVITAAEVGPDRRTFLRVHFRSAK